MTVFLLESGEIANDNQDRLDLKWAEEDLSTQHQNAVTQKVFKLSV